MCFCNTPWPEVGAQHPGFNSHNSIRNPILIVQNLDTNCHVSTRILTLLLLGLHNKGKGWGRGAPTKLEPLPYWCG